MAVNGNVILDNGVVVDAYNSAQGVYGGANVQKRGGVLASGQVINNGAMVQGTILAGAASSDPVAPLPSGYVDLGNLTISGNYTFPAGNYRVSTLNINGTPIVSAVGTVRIWFTNLNLAGTVGAGVARPGQLTFFGGAGSQVNFNGSGSFTGVIYAPGANVTFNGPTTVEGALIGGQVTLNSNVVVHEDMSLFCSGAVPGVENAGAAGKTPGVDVGTALGAQRLAAVPNPAHGTVEVLYQLQVPGHERLRLYALNGQEVESWDLGALPAGAGEVSLDLQKVAPGIYLLVSESGSAVGVSRTTFKLAVVGH